MDLREYITNSDYQLISLPAAIDADAFFVRDCDLHEFAFGDTIEFAVDSEEAEG